MSTRAYAVLAFVLSSVVLVAGSIGFAPPAPADPSPRSAPAPPPVDAPTPTPTPATAPSHPPPMTTAVVSRALPAGIVARARDAHWEDVELSHEADVALTANGDMRPFREWPVSFSTCFVDIDGPGWWRPNGAEGDVFLVIPRPMQQRIDVWRLEGGTQLVPVVLAVPNGDDGRSPTSASFRRSCDGSELTVTATGSYWLLGACPYTLRTQIIWVDGQLEAREVNDSPTCY